VLRLGASAARTNGEQQNHRSLHDFPPGRAVS
jgi:hypothetical protein